MNNRVRVLIAVCSICSVAVWGQAWSAAAGQESVLEETTGDSRVPPPVVNPNANLDDRSPSDLIVPEPVQPAGEPEKASEPAGSTESDESVDSLASANSVVPQTQSATRDSGDESRVATAPAKSVKTKVQAASSVLESAAGEGKLQPRTIPVDPAYRDLQRTVTRAKESLDAESLPTWEEAERELVLALQEVDRFLALAPSRAQGWSDFLMLDEVREEMSKERPDYRRFALFEMNMRQNYVGLERGPMLELRSALDRARRATLYGTSPEKTIRVLERRIDQLAETLAAPPEDADSQITTDIARLANYFYETEQVPWAISEMRSKFSVPNVQVYAKETVINRLIGRAVAEPSPVNECILGTRILGRACLSGSVYADILPMQGGVAVNLNLTGYLSSNNRGYNRGVVLRTTGTSPVHATKQIVATLDGISSTPAAVSTNLTTSINAIEHRLRLVRRIAKRKAAEQKPQADRISEGRLQTKLRTQYDQQVETQLAEARGKLYQARAKSQSRPEFQRLNVPRPALAVYSTNSTVNANVVQAASFQLAAAKPCSIPKPSASEAVVELHQSALNNVLHNLFAGRTIRDSDLDDLAIQFLGEVPEELQDTKTIEKFVATLPSFNPINVELDNGQVKLTLRFTELQGADRTVRGATVSVVYDIHYRDGVFTLVRQGEIDVDVSAGSNIARTSLRSAVRKKMEPMFKEVIVTDRIDLSQAMPNAPRLVLNWIKLHDGWAQVGVR